MNQGTHSHLPGWGWPLAAVIAVHLGLAVVPVEFSEANTEEPTDSDIAMMPAPDLAEPQPEPEPEPKPEPEPEPEPRPEPEPEPPVEAQEPRAQPEQPAVAVEEDPAEPEEQPPEEQVDDESQQQADIDEILEDNPIEDTELDIASDWEPQTPPSAMDDTPDEQVDWDGYGQALMRSVESQKNYPRMAERRGWEGDVTVRITVDRDGRLADRPDIVESSNHGSLDDEALRMVESAEPFDAFPDGADRDEREFVIPVRFHLEG